MCDYGRFRSEDLNRQDFTKPEIRVAGSDARKQTNWGEALDAVKVAIDRARGEGIEHVARERRRKERNIASKGRVQFIGSAHLTTEEAWLLATLCKDSLKVNAPEFVVDEGPKGGSGTRWTGGSTEQKRPPTAGAPKRPA